MPAISFNSGLGQNLGFASAGEANIPDSLKFPLNTIIPYYGNTPNISGWTRYTPADGKAIFATNTQAQIGTSLAEQLATAIPGSLASGGNHLGNIAPTQNITSTVGSGMYPQAAAVSHSHSASNTLSSGSGMRIMNTQNITLLRATKSNLTLPPNALAVRQTQLPNSSAFTSADYRYLVGALDSQATKEKIAINTNGAVIVASGGYHAHSYGSTSYTIPPTGSYTGNQTYMGSGNHTHSGNISLFQSQITSKLVKLWQLTVGCVPTTDIIVMYVGTIALLPSTWKLCDGLNGTPNLGGYVIGYRGDDWNVTTVSDIASTMTIAYNNNTHNHLAGYARANRVGSGGGYHGSYSNAHLHTASPTKISYLPPRIALAFIQYKG